MNKIYTKNGDGGRTLIKGRRAAKDDPLLEAVGALDELSCFLGLARAKAGAKKDRNLLLSIQEDVLDLNAVLAGCKDSFPFGRVRFLEEKIDFWQKKMPKQESFVFPGKTALEAYLHLCRAVCRRAERRVSTLTGTAPAVLSYLNRLSDFLFVMASRKQD